MAYNDYDDELERLRRKGRSRGKTPGGRGSSRSSYGMESRGESRSSRASYGMDPSREQRSRRTASSQRSVRESAATSAASPSTSSRMQAKRERDKKKRRIIIMIVAECLTLAAIFGYGFFLRRWNMFQRPDFNEDNVKNTNISEEVTESMKGYWTIALFGVDDRGNVIDKGTHSDVNIICNINMDTGEIKLVSVFRDTYLNVNDKNLYNKMNYAYFQGGPEQAVATLNKNLDLNIVNYASFNWKAVAEAINILGGVDIELSKAEFYYINSFITETVKATGLYSTQLTHAGMNHLDGVQAVAYGRLRLMDTDFARTERQRKIIQQAFEKAKKADWATLNNLMVTVFPQVATNVEADDLIKLARNITKYHIGETSGFPAARGDAVVGNKGACVIPATLTSNVRDLHAFLYGTQDYVPSNAVQNISAKISADTGIYKEGQSVGHVSTEGYLPKPTEAPETEAETETESESETWEIFYETDEYGESHAYRVDENGETVEVPWDEVPTTEEEATSGPPGGDASGWETWGTDENGNPVDPAWGENGGPGYEDTLPTDETTRPSGDKPTSTAASDEYGPGVPTTEASTGPTAPGEEESSSAANNTPGSSTPGGTTPGGTTPGGSTPGSNAPGSSDGTGSSLPSGPGGNNSSGSNTNTGVIISPGD